MYRNTYIEINLDNIKYNVSKIINKYNKYQYYFGVVKANCYNHGEQSIKSIIAGGCNYLAVALLEEALNIRKIGTTTPILCLGNINTNFLDTCIENNITITINSLEYAKEIEKINIDLSQLKTHIKINTGMNRLGINNERDLKETISILKGKNINIEGIYTHIYKASDEDTSKKQLDLFKKFYESVQKENFKIIHCQASEALEKYSKPNFINGCRLGIIMYGFNTIPNINLKSTFKLYSQIIQIHHLKKGDTVGYDAKYTALENEIIGVVSIGYDDGIIRQNTGRNVYINNKPYPIIGNICMDMLFIKIDNNVKLYDQVEIIKDNQHIEEIAKYLNTIPYEIMCNVGNRVPIIYKNDSLI